MLDGLSEKFQRIVKKIRGEGTLTDANMEEALGEVRQALLEGDVNVDVVKQFIERVRERARGQEVMLSLSPAQQLIKVIHLELMRLLGGADAAPSIPGRVRDGLNLKDFPSVIFLVGLQGSGKTTTASKLALYLEKRGLTPLLASTDLQRPAAREQLRILAQQHKHPYFEGTSSSVVELGRECLNQARLKGFNPLILDTAGRLHVDEALMDELVALRDSLRPSEVLYVADSMTGQDAVRSSQAFNARLNLTGIILTKLDGDSRGGAALSIREVTGKPIRFAGTGEKPGDFEVFQPDRMTSRILGMGDILGLIEKAEETVSIKESLKLQEKLRKNRFTLEDMLGQIRQIKKMGSFADLMKMLPGGLGVPAGMDLDDRQLLHTEAIIQSMTVLERENPDIIDGNRRKRIASGCGRPVQEINQLLRSFAEMRKMMKRFRPGKRLAGLPRI
ncbi:MAG: signal recognition particle protein [Acidobacteria bacterium]|nr:signal recognition particle protein [Acidobacteriota bacterium]